MTLKIMASLFLLFVLVSSIAFSTIEYLDFDLSNFPLVNLLVSMNGYYLIDANEFSENDNTLPCNISLLKEIGTESINVHFFVDTSLSMNNKVKTVHRSLEEITGSLKNIESDKIFYFHSLEYFVDSVTMTDSLETNTIVRTLFSKIGNPDEQPLKYLQKTIDNTTSPSMFILFTDTDGFENIETDKMEETSKKLYSAGYYLFVVSDSAEKIEAQNASFIDYSQIYEITSVMHEIKHYLLKISFTSADTNMPLHTVSIYGNEKTYVSPMKDIPTISLVEDYENQKYKSGDTLQISGSAQGDFHSFSVTHNNSPVSFSLDENEFSFKITFEEGINTINITTSGNQGKCVLKKNLLAIKEKQSTLEVFLKWEAEKADIDLYIKEPAGWVYFLNKEEFGFLEADVQSGNKDGEYYSLPKVIPGKYEIYVHAYKIEQPTIGNVTVLLDGVEISNKSFRFNKSNIENCFPGDTGDDWQLIEKIDL
ncbi:MAG: hypothetical protein R6U52_10825 [Kosmotogaceae bacterium]